MIDSLATPAIDLKNGWTAKPANGTPVVDRLPPHSPEAEQGMLGCILLSPNESMPQCIEKFKGNAEVLYDLRNRTIFEVLTQMYDQREAIDTITLHQRLKDRQFLEQIGGVAYLSGLADSVPSAANLSYYLEIVQEKFLLRRMIHVCTDIVGRVYDYQGEVDALMDEVERDILRISESRVSEAADGMKQLVNRAITTIEEFHARQGQLSGIGTGFRDLDKMTSGLHAGEMIVIAARPSLGKTSLAMNIAEYAAVEQGLPVGVFSLEMTAEALVLRMLCSRARVNLRNIREGFLAEQDFPKLTTAAGLLARSPLFIDDTSGLSILQLRAKARRLQQQHQIKLFVVDYLQLLHSSSRRVDNRQQEIADISSGIKALAKELEVPIIVLSQLNRDFEKDKSRKPNMADLRESGSIEQDADLVGLLYRSDPEDPTKRRDSEDDALSEDVLPINLLIAKQRNGPTGDVHLVFQRSYTRFESAAKISDADVS